MPMNEINLVPGVNVESTAADNPSGVQESDQIRFRGNLVEKRGGCTLYINERLDGIPNDIQPWGDIAGRPYVGVSTDTEVYAYEQFNNQLRIISPQYIETHSVPINLSTVAGSSLVTVVDNTVQNLTVYDSVTFNTPVSIGGLILQNSYPIVEAQGVNTYVIDVGYLATTTVNNGGAVPQFITNAGSTEIQVNFPIEYQYGKLVIGDRIGFTTPTPVGGLTVAGQYIVTRILNQTKFTVVDDEAAPTSASAFLNNGNLDLTYWIVDGPTIFGSGYGTNAYGQYGYGQGSANPPVTGNTYQASNWYLDNRGASLIASAVGGPIFYWNNTNGYQNLAIFDNAPVKSNGAFVAMPYGNVMAWGCSDTINPLQNPLYIRWSDSKDPSNWSIAGNSDAGFYNIPTGSKIVRGIQGQTQQYWFTDVDVYSAQYIGYPGTFSFNKIGNGCGLVAPKAVGLLGSNLFWMSNREFFICPAGGAPQPIPCTVWDFIFQNINEKYKDRVICGTNSLFNEVVWYFPTMDETQGNPPNQYDGVPNAYVCYNAQYNLWDYGYTNRTAWADQSLVGEPLATDSAGYVYQHETSNNQAIGPLTFPLSSYFKTGYYSITNGQDLSFVDWILPDAKWGQYDEPQTAELYFKFYVTDYAGQVPREYGPYTFTKETPFLCPRFRGRFMAVEMGSKDANSFWRIGSIRYRFAPSGRR